MPILNGQNSGVKVEGKKKPVDPTCAESDSPIQNERNDGAFLDRTNAALVSLIFRLRYDMNCA